MSACLYTAETAFEQGGPELLADLLNILSEHCGERGDNEGAAETVKRLIRERDEAVALLRAIWHSEGPDKWPGPADFRRRVEALIGSPPPGRFNTMTKSYGSP